MQTVARSFFNDIYVIVHRFCCVFVDIIHDDIKRWTLWVVASYVTVYLYLFWPDFCGLTSEEGLLSMNEFCYFYHNVPRSPKYTSC